MSVAGDALGVDIKAKIDAYGGTEDRDDLFSAVGNALVDNKELYKILTSSSDASGGKFLDEKINTNHFQIASDKLELKKGLYLPTSEISCVHAYTSVTQAFSHGSITKIMFPIAGYDDLGEWHTTNNRFTADATGKYSFKGIWAMDNFPSGSMFIYIKKNTGYFGYIAKYKHITGYAYMNFTFNLQLNINEYVEIWGQHWMGGLYSTLAGRSHLWITRVK